MNYFTRFSWVLISEYVVPDVLTKFSKIENLFFFRGSARCQYQLKLYCLSVTDNFGLGNEPKLKETTVNYFGFRHQQWIEEYTNDNSESVNQDARIVWASHISSLEVARYDCLPHHFLPNVSISSVSRKY